MMLLAGAILFLLWPVLAATFSGHLLVCTLAGLSLCSDAENLSDFFAIGPTIIGAFLLALGFVHDMKRENPPKKLIVLSITIVLSFIAFLLTWIWFYVFVLLSQMFS